MIRLEKNLRRLRKEAGFTQAQLADKLGVSFQAVSRWETGAAYPDIALLPELAAAFHVSVDTLLGITEARERDISVVTAELRAAYSSPIDTQTIISCLRELRHFHLTSPEFWSAMRALPRDVLASPEVRPELRLVFDAIWESDETNAFVKSSAVVWRATWEDDDRIERFLEVYSTSVDLSKEELLRSRAEYRQDWETLEPLRQRALMGRVSNLAASSAMWLPQGRPSTPKECFDLTSLQLRFLNSLSSPETGSYDALSSGKLDGWTGIRLYLGPSLRQSGCPGQDGAGDGCFKGADGIDGISLLPPASRVDPLSRSLVFRRGVDGPGNMAAMLVGRSRTGRTEFEFLLYGRRP